MDSLLKIGISHGDINSISYEIILKTLVDARMSELCTPVIFGSSKALGYYKKVLNLDHISVNVVRSAADAVAGRVNVVNCSAEELKIEMGVPTAESGKYALMALEQASEALNNGEIDALVTAPISKSAMPHEAFPYAGHTEYFEAKTNAKGLMLLTNECLRVALVTNHLAIKNVADAISEEKILEKLTMLNQTLQQDFSVRKPRIAVLSLNPHAGDGGLFGDEEATIIAPAIEKANAQGMQCFGPFAADGFWGSNEVKSFDAVLAMYHDQGLVPFKLMGMDAGVNFTAGLPVVRTSPDHGTAFNLVGKNVANENSFRQAIFSAIDIVRNRRIYAEISANPIVIEEKNAFDRQKKRENV